MITVGAGARRGGDPPRRRSDYGGADRGRRTPPGVRVNVWTANRWSTIRQLIAWDVDGIFTDYPERVIIARAQMAAQAAPQQAG